MNLILFKTVSSTRWPVEEIDMHFLCLTLSKTETLTADVSGRQRVLGSRHDLTEIVTHPPSEDVADRPRTPILDDPHR